MLEQFFNKKPTYPPQYGFYQQQPQENPSQPQNPPLNQNQFQQGPQPTPNYYQPPQPPDQMMTYTTQKDATIAAIEVMKARKEHDLTCMVAIAVLIGTLAGLFSPLLGAGASLVGFAIIAFFFKKNKNVMNYIRFKYGV